MQNNMFLIIAIINLNNYFHLMPLFFESNHHSQGEPEVFATFVLTEVHSPSYTISHTNSCPNKNVSLIHVLDIAHNSGMNSDIFQNTNSGQGL